MLAFLLTSSQTARIVKRFGETEVLEEVDFRWEFERPYEIALEVSGTEFAGWIDGKEILRIADNTGSLTDGGFAFVCEEGLITSDEITIRPTTGIHEVTRITQKLLKLAYSRSVRYRSASMAAAHP